MKYLKDNGYETITLNELDRYLAKKLNLPAKTVAITFDDGLKSNYIYAYPKLEEYGFKATEFVISNRIKDIPTPFDPNTLQFISSGEIEEMKDIFKFENHTHAMHGTTNGVPLLIASSKDEIVADLKTNSSILSSKYLAYPFGAFDSETIQASKEAGVSMAFTTVNGNATIGSDLYQLNRRIVTPSTTMETFASWVSEK
jgi:peptidoglycan/xylan/chitin deacetylase (PgdA/CDA1 family)